MNGLSFVSNNPPISTIFKFLTHGFAMRPAHFWISLFIATLMPAIVAAKNVALVIGNSAYQSVSVLPLRNGCDERIVGVS